MLDVVPWVPLEGWPLRDASEGPATEAARRARDSFAAWAGTELRLPAFLYGPEQSLPQVRRGAWRTLRTGLRPVLAPPDSRGGGRRLRGLLVAYNLWLRGDDLGLAKATAAAVRRPAVRALGLPVAGGVQVSCNLVDPLRLGPADMWDRVAGAGHDRPRRAGGAHPGAPPWTRCHANAGSSLTFRRDARSKRGSAGRRGQEAATSYRANGEACLGVTETSLAGGSLVQREPETQEAWLTR